MIGSLSRSRLSRFAALVLTAWTVACGPIPQGSQPGQPIVYPVSQSYGSLQNGDFETGNLDGWTSAGTVSIARDSHQGLYAAQVGAPTENRVNSLSQTFVMPSNARTLSFWTLASCEGPASGGSVVGTLGPAGGGLALTVLPPSCAQSATWTESTSDVSGYAGELVTLTFAAYGSASTSAFLLLDDVAVQAATVAPPPVCQSSADCGPDQTCNDGACEPTLPAPSACTTDAQCGSWEICVDGGCVAPPGEGGGAGDSGCSSDAECGAGQVCDVGACVSAPTGSTSCSSDSDCAGGETCDAGACVQPTAPVQGCSDDSDCGGWSCSGGTCTDPGTGCAVGDPTCDGGAGGTGCAPGDTSCDGSGGSSGSDGGDCAAGDSSCDGGDTGGDSGGDDCGGDASCELQRARHHAVKARKTHASTQSLKVN